MGTSPSSLSSENITVDRVREKSTEKPITYINTAGEVKDQFSKPVAEPPVENSKWTPHNYDAIVKEADDNLGQKIDGNMYSGFFLKNKTKKYWVDRDSGCNCFMIYARELSITWSEDCRYWKWIYMKETSEVDIQVACLLDVCWLEVHGKLKKVHPTPNTTYEVVFVVMLKDPAYGWEYPVNLRLVSSKNTIQEHNRCLMEIPRGRWVEIVVGDFIVPATSIASIDEIEFSMFEYEGGDWKRGLLVKGVIIRPKKYFGM